MRSFLASRAALMLAAILPLSLCAQTLAQEANDEQQSPANVPSNASDDQQSDQQSAMISLDDVHLNIVDQKLALSLAVDTWGQIRAAETVLPSIHDEALKTCLTARLESQRQFLSQLETLTGGRCGEAIKDAIAEIERNAKAETTSTVHFRPLALSRNATAMIVRIRVEILQQYLQSITQHLGSYSADDFDRHFLRTDLLHQLQMQAMLKVFAGQASADFAEVIQAAATTAEQQLGQSRHVLLQMETPSLVASPAVVPVLKTAGAQ